MMAPNQNQLITKIFSDLKTRRALASESFYWFFHLYFSHYITYPTAKFQRDIMDLCQNNQKSLLVITTFRNSGKSSIVNMAFVIWSLVGKPQKHLILTFAQNQERAKENLSNIKQELESNQLLINDFGPFAIDNEEWRANVLSLNKYQSKIRACSIEEGVRGLRFRQYRPNLVVIDDPQDEQSSRTFSNREKAFRWFSREIVTLGDEGTQIILIGNYLREDCLTARLSREIIENQRPGNIFVMPIIDSKGNSNWPERFKTQDDLDNLKKSVGEEAWLSEYCLQDTSKRQKVINPDKFNYYSELDKLPFAKTTTRIRICVDPAYTTNDGSNNTAILVAGFNSSKNDKLKIVFLPIVVNKQMEVLEIIQTVKSIYHGLKNKHSDVKVVLESVAAQVYLVQLLRQEGIIVIEFKPAGDKLSRLKNASFFVESGMVWLPNHSMEELINQITDFEVDGINDLADAFSMGCLDINDEYNKIPTFDVFILR